MSPFPANHPTARRSLHVVVTIAVSIGVRQLADVVLRSTFPALSAATTLFVETLVLTCLYGALAWRYVVLPARHRPTPPQPQRSEGLALVHAAPPVGASGTRPIRHLALVPDLPGSARPRNC